MGLRRLGDYRMHFIDKRCKDIKKGSKCVD